MWWLGENKSVHKKRSEFSSQQEGTDAQCFLFIALPSNWLKNREWMLTDRFFLPPNCFRWKHLLSIPYLPLQWKFHISNYCHTLWYTVQSEHNRDRKGTRSSQPTGKLSRRTLRRVYCIFVNHVALSSPHPPRF